MSVRSIVPPTDMPKAVAGGAAVALWGVALLVGALPGLACLPSSRRTLRLGAVGVYLGCAFVGLQSESASGARGGLATSLGYLITLVMDSVCFARGCVAAVPHVYSRLPVQDEEPAAAAELADPGVEMTGSGEDTAEGADGAEQLPDGDPDDSRNVALAFAGRTEFSVESVVPALAVCVFALARGLDLGVGVLRLAEPDLDIAMVSVIGQVSLAAAALSVLLQDSGLELSRSASLVLFYSLMAPLGVAVGVVQVVTHEGLQQVGMLASGVGGVVLFYTMSRLLPKERIALAQEVNRKGAQGVSHGQTVRLANLLAGWGAMVALNWPRLGFGADD